MHAVDRVDGEALEQPLLHHDPAAAEPFLRRLKDEMHRAGEIAALGEITRRSEQHRRMAVVTAGVHLSRNRRAMRGPLRLLDVERVEVGAQRDRSLAGPAPANRSHDPGLGEALGDVDAPAAQFVGDNPGGARLLERGLRMAMDVAANGDQFGLVGLEGVKDFGARRLPWSLPRFACSLFAGT